jgi:arylsulfatase A-like enzyme
MFHLRHYLLLFLLLFISSCQPVESGFEISLLDNSHTPDILTESRVLAFPPTTESNRFLRGWRLRRGGGKRTLAAQPRETGTSLEIVNLGSRTRELVLYGSLGQLPADAKVEVSTAGRSLGKIPLVTPLRIPLPPDLPIGRVPIELRFPYTGEIRVRKASLEPTLPKGVVNIETDEIRQSGTSLVDLVRRFEAPAVLRMRFSPPHQPEIGQRFALLLEIEGKPATTVFEWSPGLWSRLRGVRNFEIPIPSGSGLVRLRLLAEGKGSAATWRPRLWFPDTPREIPLDEPPPPPRLVILYVLDALRADFMGHLGGPLGISPHFDRLAADGVSLRDHLSVAPNTLPSSMSLFTGQIFLELNQGRWNLAPDGPETLAEVFQEAGFETAIFAANGYLSEGFGTTRGFDFESRESTYDPNHASHNDSAERVHRATLDWLDKRTSKGPAFLYLHSLNPHNPYAPPEPFRSRFVPDGNSDLDGGTSTLRKIKQFRRLVNAEDKARLKGLYAGGLSYNDLHFGLFLAEIEKRFKPGEVLVIVTSDHGDEFFEHGGVLHGYTLYKEQLAIPLIFWWPDHLVPNRLHAATDNLDLHETLRALVGAPHSGRGTGRSLWPLLMNPTGGAPTTEGGKGVRFAVASGVKGGIFMARSAHAKLLWAPRTGAGWGLGEGLGRSRDPEYFFDLVGDPGETTNLIDRPSLEKSWLRSRLLAWIERSRAIEVGTTEDGGELDERTRKHLKALGYLD